MMKQQLVLHYCESLVMYVLNTNIFLILEKVM